MYVSLRQKLHLALFPLLLVVGFILVPTHSFADPADPATTTVKCKDGTTQTVHRTGKTFNPSDFDTACKGHGGVPAGTATGCDTNTQVCGGSTSHDTAVDGGNCSSVSNCDLIQKYINPLVNLLAALVGVAVVISIVVGGIQYSNSGGDPQAVSAAKNRIRNAIIALLTFIFLYALLNFLIPGGLL